jgi:hypothetical protein
VKTVAGGHLARALARHRAHGLQCRAIQCPPVSRQSGTEYRTIITCWLTYWPLISARRATPYHAYPVDSSAARKSILR